MPTTEDKMIDLLYWVKDIGVVPESPKRKDQYLNPFTRKIVRLEGPQKKHASRMLWIPNKDGVKYYLPALKVEDEQGFKVATLGRWIGLGIGESEAILSLLNSVRQALPFEPMQS